MNENSFEYNFEGKKLVFEIDNIAVKCSKSVICRFENTVVLTVLTVKKGTKKVYPFFPLSVFFEERSYASGRIPNVFNRREGKPNYDAIKAARLIDHSLRNFFSSNEIDLEVQISNLVVSVDKECSPVLAAVWASSLACFLSTDLPFFNEAVTTVVVGKKNGELLCVFNQEELFFSPFEIIASVNKTNINSLEIRGNESSEEELKEGLEFAVKKANLLAVFFQKIAVIFSKEESKKYLKEEKTSFVLQIGDEEKKKIKQIIKTELQQIINSELSWLEKENEIELLLKKTKETFFSSSHLIEVSESNFTVFLEKTLDECLKELLVVLQKEKGVRLDGRNNQEIRPLKINIGYLPTETVHGSGLFARGNTQVLSVAAVGKISEKQSIESFSRNLHKYFIHHYNFPDFSVNKLSTGSRYVNRREVGHGELVEKTFTHLLPTVDVLPYTIRVVSEVLSSDGSSSQASICATSLALVSSGIPLSRMAAGVSLGLFNGEIYTDINGVEDRLSDIDFKIAGTEKGVCSAQLDVKTQGITVSLIENCLKRAKEARLFILGKMSNSLLKQPSSPSSVMKWKKIYIGEEKVGLLIGPGGKTINSLTQTTGASIEIQTGGYLLIYHSSEIKLKEVCEKIMRMTRERGRG